MEFLIFKWATRRKYTASTGGYKCVVWLPERLWVLVTLQVSYRQWLWTCMYRHPVHSASLITLYLGEATWGLMVSAPVLRQIVQCAVRSQKGFDLWFNSSTLQKCYWKRHWIPPVQQRGRTSGEYFTKKSKPYRVEESLQDSNLQAFSICGCRIGHLENNVTTKCAAQGCKSLKTAYNLHTWLYNQCPVTLSEEMTLHEP